MTTFDKWWEEKGRHTMVGNPGDSGSYVLLTDELVYKEIAKLAWNIQEKTIKSLRNEIMFQEAVIKTADQM